MIDLLNFNQNKKYYITVGVVFGMMVVFVGVMYYRYPLPIGDNPKSIIETKIISDKGAKQTCSLNPFTQELTTENTLFEVSLFPSYKNSRYFLEVGGLPKGISAFFDKQEGRGDDIRKLYISKNDEAISGSFTLTVAYHEWQGFNRWLVNYCLLNVVVPKN